MYACECMHIYVSMCICIYKYANKSPIFYLSIRLPPFLYAFSFSPVSQFLFPPIFSLYLSLSFSLSVSPYFFLPHTLSLPLHNSFSLTFFLSLPLSLPLSFLLSLSLSLSLSLFLFPTLSFQGGNIAYQSGRYSYQTFRTRVSPYDRKFLSTSSR